MISGAREVGPVEHAVGLLHETPRAAAVTPRDWNRILPGLFAHQLAGTLGAILAERGVLARIDADAARHLQAARRIAEQRRAVMTVELGHLDTAMADAGIPFVLLKGAAYMASDSPAARGRLFEDLDLMVAPENLATAERALWRAGWAPERLSAYDERYYREWMHQVPPLIHPLRGSAVDLHHGLVPRTSRLHLDSARFRRRARPAHGWSAFLHLPQPADLVLHSAVHALAQEDLRSALRDLVDIYRIVDHHRGDPAFWRDLEAHREAPDAARHIALAFDLLDRRLGLALPREADAIRQGVPGRRWRLAAFAPAVVAGADPSARTQAARFALFVRGHYLKMPLGRLVRHLGHKARRPDGAATGGTNPRAKAQ